jgi:hypothetical protein
VVEQLLQLAPWLAPAIQTIRVASLVNSNLNSNETHNQQSFPQPSMAITNYHAMSGQSTGGFFHNTATNGYLLALSKATANAPLWNSLELQPLYNKCPSPVSQNTPLDVHPALGTGDQQAIVNVDATKGNEPATILAKQQPAY